MEYIIGRNKFSFKNNIRNNKTLRLSFNTLAQKTFGLSFEPWYKQGFWTDKYIPYIFLDNDKVVANVSVNIIDTVWKGKQKRYIQLGTVMTDNNYRKKGLSRYLVEKALKDWQNKCEAVYLFANDAVFDFYPKFGFIKANEHQSSMLITPKTGKVRKLEMSNKADVNRLHFYYKKSNPFSAFPMVDNWGLLMFYCSSFMKDCVYYVEDYDAIIIGEQNETKFTCFDIFFDKEKNISMTDILSFAVGKQTQTVLFGFSLKDRNMDCLLPLQEDDNTLFILANKENLFLENKMMFPLLSCA